MSLFRTYDVTWPEQTQQSLSWADTLDVGISVAAPGCWLHHYNFFVFYLIQMALPVPPTSFPPPHPGSLKHQWQMCCVSWSSADEGVDCN